MIKYSIYTLANPDNGNIFYVGKSVNLENRLQSHMDIRNTDESFKSEIIRFLLSNGKKPIIEEIDSFECIYREDEDFVGQMEVYWMHQLKSWGIEIININGLIKPYVGGRRFSKTLKESTFEKIMNFLDEKQKYLSGLKEEIKTSNDITEEERTWLLWDVKKCYYDIHKRICDTVGVEVPEFTEPEPFNPHLIS